MLIHMGYFELGSSSSIKPEWTVPFERLVVRGYQGSKAQYSEPHARMNIVSISALTRRPIYEKARSISSITPPMTRGDAAS